MVEIELNESLRRRREELVAAYTGNAVHQVALGQRIDRAFSNGVEISKVNILYAWKSID